MTVKHGAVLFSLCLLLISAASAEPDSVVWSIGQVDGSNAEFAVSKDPFSFLQSFPDDVVYTVGQSTPQKDWAGIQPGPGDEWGGKRSKGFTVVFDLPQEKAQEYRLEIRLVGYHPNSPTGMRVTVNRKSFTLFFPPGGHQDGWRNFSLAKPFHFDLPVPASLLKSTHNHIEMTPLSNWLIWDALRLVRQDQENAMQIDPDEVECEVLPLFVKKGSRFFQYANLTLFTQKPVKELRIQMHQDGDTSIHKLSSDGLGYVSQKILIPEIKRKGTIQLDILHKKNVLATKSLPVRPARKWTIAIVPQAHVDIGYTHVQDEAMEVHCKSNDTALQLMKKYPDFTWSVESSYVMQKWIQSRPQELIQHFFEKAQKDKLEIEAIYGNLLTGLLSDEEAFRALYYSKQLSRKYKSVFASATLTDAPSHIWSMPTVLRKSGIKYLSMGINQTRAPLLRGGLYERSPIWWEGPDGSKILAFFHNHYAGAGALGLMEAWPGQYQTHASLQTAERKIPELIRFYDRPDYPYDSIHIHGAYGDNRGLTEELPRNVKAWNKKYAFPKLVFTTNTEWFSSIEKRYGQHLDTVRGDGGAFWEDGAGSTARETAVNRRNQQKALLAEMLLTGLHAKGIVQEDYREIFADLWHDIMLYDEHTWGAHNSISSPEKAFVLKQYKIKSDYAYSAQQSIHPLLEIAQQHIPAVPEPKTQWILQDNQLKTDSYKITFDLKRGGISSIIDLGSERELIDTQAPYLLGQLLYAKNEKPPYAVSTATFYGLSSLHDEVILQLQHEMFPEINVHIRVDDSRKKIDLRYEFEKVPTYQKEGVYIAFPLKGNHPQIDYAVANAVVRAGRDWLPGSCKDWFTLQNWLRVRSDGWDSLFITYDAPLISLQDINPNKWLKELPIQNGHVYAYLMNNYWMTNYKAAQGGHYSFRFSLATAKEIPFARACRLGRDWNAGERAAADAMIQTTPDNVLVSAFKRAEQGDGYIVRLREMSGQATEAHLRIPAMSQVSKAHLCNGVEDTIRDLPLTNGAIAVSLNPWDVVTIKVQP